MNSKSLLFGVLEARERHSNAPRGRGEHYFAEKHASTSIEVLYKHWISLSSRRIGSASCIVLCLIWDFLFLLLKRMIWPWDWQILQEYQALNRTMKVPRWAVEGAATPEDDEKKNELI